MKIFSKVNNHACLEKDDYLNCLRSFLFFSTKPVDVLVPLNMLGTTSLWLSKLKEAYYQKIIALEAECPLLW